MYSSHVFIYHVPFIHPRLRHIAAPPALQALFIKFIYLVSPAPHAHIIHRRHRRIAAPPAPQADIIQFIYHVLPVRQVYHYTTRAAGAFHQVHLFIYVVIQLSIVHHPRSRRVSPFAPQVQFTFHFQFRLNSSRAADTPLLARQWHHFSHRRPHAAGAFRYPILFPPSHLSISPFDLAPQAQLSSHAEGPTPQAPSAILFPPYLL
jgi:hypothetical protein